MPPLPPSWDGGGEFADLLKATRLVQDLTNGTNPPAEVMREITDQLGEVANRLKPWTCEESDLIAGRRQDLPGRGHSMLPAFVVDEQTENSVKGRVRFTTFYLGGNGAVHGGALPLFFDDILGRLSNCGGRSIARTAYLHVNYRHITEIGRELKFDATFEREEGRKRYVTGHLFDRGTLVADAEGLFVMLLPGQP